MERDQHGEHSPGEQCDPRCLENEERGVVGNDKLPCSVDNIIWSLRALGCTAPAVRAAQGNERAGGDQGVASCQDGETMVVVEHATALGAMFTAVSMLIVSNTPLNLPGILPRP